MAEDDYVSLSQMRIVLWLRRVPDPSAFERGNTMRTFQPGVGPSW